MADLILHLEPQTKRHEYLESGISDVPKGTPFHRDVIDIGGGVQVQTILYGSAAAKQGL